MSGRSCKGVAVDLLSRREHSSAELRTKLAQRSFDSVEIDSVVRSLGADNLLSDERYAESFARLHVARGQGPTRISQELRQKGISDELIKRALAVYREQWLELAAAVRRKKFASRPSSYQERVKQARFLQYKGFTTDQITVILDRD